MLPERNRILSTRTMSAFSFQRAIVSRNAPPSAKLKDSSACRPLSAILSPFCAHSKGTCCRGFCTKANPRSFVPPSKDLKQDEMLLWERDPAYRTQVSKRAEQVWTVRCSNEGLVVPTLDCRDHSRECPLPLTGAGQAYDAGERPDLPLPGGPVTRYPRRLYGRSAYRGHHRRGAAIG